MTDIAPCPTCGKPRTAAGLHDWRVIPEAGAACDCHGIRQGFWCVNCRKLETVRYPDYPDYNGCEAAAQPSGALRAFIVKQLAHDWWTAELMVQATSREELARKVDALAADD